MQNDKRKLRHRKINIAYTRKEYIRRIPEGKEKQMKFTYGDENQAFQHELRLISINEKYLSANSLDAVRVAMNHILEQGSVSCYLKFYPYPHQILREHGLLGVLKAERMAKGMKHSFGRSASKVAHVYPNQVLLTLRVNDNLLKKGIKALDIASKKLSCHSRIEKI